MSKREWLVMLIVAMLLLGIGLPYLQVSRENARRNTCDQSLAELGQALVRVHELRGALPGYRESQSVERPEPVSWAFAMLPYLGLTPTKEELLEKQFSAQRRGDYDPLQKHWLAGGKLRKQAEVRLRPLCCPAVRPNDREPARIQYVANCGMPDAPPTAQFPADWPANGMFQDRNAASDQPLKIADPLTLRDVYQLDGRASTLLFSENLDAGAWTEPGEFKSGFIWQAELRGGAVVRQSPLLGLNEQTGRGDGSLAFARPSALHPRGVNAVFADGHTQFLEQRLDDEIFVRLMTVDDTALRWPGQDELLPIELRRPPAAPDTMPAGE